MGVGGFFVDAAPMPGEVELEEFGAALNKLTDAELLSGSNNVILRLFLLKHEPLHLDVVAGVAPVAFGIQVAEKKGLLQACLDAGKAARDLAGDEGLAA